MCQVWEEIQVWSELASLLPNIANSGLIFRRVLFQFCPIIFHVGSRNCKIIWPISCRRCARASHKWSVCSLECLLLFRLKQTISHNRFLSLFQFNDSIIVYLVLGYQMRLLIVCKLFKSVHHCKSLALLVLTLDFFVLEELDKRISSFRNIAVVLRTWWGRVNHRSLVRQKALFNIFNSCHYVFLEFVSFLFCRCGCIGLLSRRRLLGLEFNRALSYLCFL